MVGVCALALPVIGALSKTLLMLALLLFWVLQALVLGISFSEIWLGPPRVRAHERSPEAAPQQA
jgi:hypothetical protein